MSLPPYTLLEYNSLRGGVTIDLHYLPTPNGKTITLMLEETELQYRIFPVDINWGEQPKPEFLERSPNNMMPAIVDRDVPGNDGRGYLAEKTGKLLPVGAA